MSKSSINIMAGSLSFLSHNDRSRKTKNSIFSDEKNEVSCDAIVARKIYYTELEKRSKKYESRTGQKIQKKTVTHLSAIVNLNAHHNLDDLQPLVKHLEKTLDTKVIQVAVHRDEGHVSEGEQKKNYHAHIEMMGIDSQGRSVRRKLTKKYLSNLQTVTAEVLRMTRGKNYGELREPRPRRVPTYEFKRMKAAADKEKQKRQEAEATLKELKEEMKKQRARLQKLGAIREDYAALEEANSYLQGQVKKYKMSSQTMTKEVIDLSEKLEEAILARNRVEEMEEVAESAKKALTAEIEPLKEENEVLKREREEMEEVIWDQERMINKLKQLYNMVRKHFMRGRRADLQVAMGVDPSEKNIDAVIEVLQGDEDKAKKLNRSRGILR